MFRMKNSTADDMARFERQAARVPDAMRAQPPESLKLDALITAIGAALWTRPALVGIGIRICARSTGIRAIALGSPVAVGTAAF